MPAEFWYTISDATHDLPAGMDGWTLGAGANKNVAVQVGGGRAGPATHDDDTSYVEATGAQRQALNASWPGPIVSFNSLTAGFRLRETAVAVQSVSQEFSDAAGTLSTTFNTTDPGGVYQTVNPIDVAALRPGGGSWVPADFVDDKTMFPTVVSSATAIRVTSVWGVLDYVAPVGGFAFLLNLAGLGALPFVGAMDFSQFTRYLSWRRRYHPRRTILTGDEVVRAWDEIRAYRHPRFFFPAVV